MSTKVSDLSYLNQTMGENKRLVREIIDVFLVEVPRNLIDMNDAVALENYVAIKNIAHTMTSTARIMGISKLLPILEQMKNLSSDQSHLDKILKLKIEADEIWRQSIEEIKDAKKEYI